MDTTISEILVRLDQEESPRSMKHRIILPLINDETIVHGISLSIEPTTYLPLLPKARRRTQTQFPPNIRRENLNQGAIQRVTQRCTATHRREANLKRAVDPNAYQNPSWKDSENSSSGIYSPYQIPEYTKCQDMVSAVVKELSSHKEVRKMVEMKKVMLELLQKQGKEDKELTNTIDKKLSYIFDPLIER